MIKLDFYIEPPTGLGEQAIDWWRPQIREFVENAVADLAARIKSKLGRQGTSLPGQPPGMQSGDYEKSWGHEIKEYKRSTHGRVGSTLWQRFGDSLELGNHRIRPRPHVGNTIEAWQRDVKRQIEQNNA